MYQWWFVPFILRALMYKQGKAFAINLRTTRDSVVLLWTQGYHLFIQDSAAHANSKINFHKPIIFVTIHNCPIYTWLSHFDPYKLVTVLSELFILFSFPWNKENILCHNFKYDLEGFTFSFFKWLNNRKSSKQHISLETAHDLLCWLPLSCLSMGRQGRWTFKNRIRLFHR